MTRKVTPNICDLCQGEIPIDQMSYTVQFSQKQPYGKGTKGKFVSSSNKADLCKADFMKFCEGNYTVEWKTMAQDKDGKWKQED